MNPPDKTLPPRAPDLRTGLIRLARNGLGLLLTRLELLAIEFSEVRHQLIRLFILFSMAVMSAWFAIAYASLLLVYLTWAQLGWISLALLAILFAVVSLVLFMYILSEIRLGRLSMPASMAEFEADRQVLQAGHPPAASAPPPEEPLP
ncbi:phage holin family protein [Leeia oryzae]|uniref:phage holin family protein n=1 Tax=Leeia oryzae TaxID=356662 RepID=UPI0003814A2F|nr:phage holin family protein [Leeia oryzae]